MLPLLPLLTCMTALLASPGSAFVMQAGPLIMYADTTAMAFFTAEQHCQSLGGALAGDFVSADMPLLTGIRNHIASGFWVGGQPHIGGGGFYRWTSSLAMINADLWCPKEPDCSGACGVAYGFIGGRNGLFSDSAIKSKRPALCSFNTRDRKQMDILRQQSGRMTNADRAALFKLLH